MLINGHCLYQINYKKNRQNTKYHNALVFFCGHDHQVSSAGQRRSGWLCVENSSRSMSGRLRRWGESEGVGCDGA